MRRLGEGESPFRHAGIGHSPEWASGHILIKFTIHHALPQPGSQDIGIQVQGMAGYPSGRGRLQRRALFQPAFDLGQECNYVGHETCKLEDGVIHLML
jgi:hypothetical protein